MTCKAAPLKATVHMRAVSNLEKLTNYKKTKKIKKCQRRERNKAAYLRDHGIKKEVMEVMTILSSKVHFKHE